MRVLFALLMIFLLSGYSTYYVNPKTGRLETVENDPGDYNPSGNLGDPDAIPSDVTEETLSPDLNLDESGKGKEIAADLAKTKTKIKIRASGEKADVKKGEYLISEQGEPNKELSGNVVGAAGTSLASSGPEGSSSSGSFTCNTSGDHGTRKEYGDLLKRLNKVLFTFVFGVAPPELVRRKLYPFTRSTSRDHGTRKEKEYEDLLKRLNRDLFTFVFGVAPPELVREKLFPFTRSTPRDHGTRKEYGGFLKNLNKILSAPEYGVAPTALSPSYKYGEADKDKKKEALDKKLKNGLVRAKKLKKNIAADLAKTKIRASGEKADVKEDEDLISELEKLNKRLSGKPNKSDKEVASYLAKIKASGFLRKPFPFTRSTPRDHGLKGKRSCFTKAKSIIVGANSDVGSGARLKQKVRKTVGGLLGGFLGTGASSTFGMGGGRGIGGLGAGFPSAGSSSRESGDNDIKTKEDPIPKNKKRIFTDPATGTKIAVGINTTPDGMLVSTNIVDSPGDGTFQTIYLEDTQGRRAGPIRYDIYELYSDWKLTVSWTRDYYENGKHVKHEEGGWSNDGRDILGTFKVPVENDGIWKQLGFSNAVQGIKGMGVFFPVKPKTLKRNPMKLVIQITRPDQDPVTTVPIDVCIGLTHHGVPQKNPIDPSITPPGYDIRSVLGPNMPVFDAQPPIPILTAKRTKGILINPLNSQGTPDISCLM